MALSALAKLIKGLKYFLKHDSGKLADELGWRGILDNFTNIAKIAYRNAEDGFAQVTKWHNGDWLANLPMHATIPYSLEVIGRGVGLPVARMASEAAAWPWPWAGR